MEKWAGKIAVVTGASVGIGAAIVKNFAKNGIVVIGLARRSEKIEEIARNLDGGCGKIYVKKCDVSDLKSIKEAFKWIEEEFGVVHIIVNNAAILFNGKILGESEETAENLNNVINTNLTGVVHCTREAVRLIKNSNEHGMIININSVLGHNIPFSGARLNVYPPTKYALTAISEVLRQELIVDNNEKIRVTNLSPGSVKTDIVVSGGFADNNDDYFKQMSCLSAEDVAETVSFLLETPHNVNISQLTIMPVGER